MARPQIAVVSYYAHHPWGPRGLRTRAILDALDGTWDATLVDGPRSDFGRPTNRLDRVARFVGYKLHESLAIDLHELWSKRHVRPWKRLPDLALVIGYPFSPAVEVARSLRGHGVPIVVDMSDPWALTAARPGLGRIGLARARRAEAALWRAASGAILTTKRQERALTALFPHLRTLVRPNGYQPVAAAHVSPGATPGPIRRQETLRIGHFGNLYYPRVNVVPFLSRLAESGMWDSVVLEQFGGDWNRTLDQLPAGVKLRSQATVSWARVPQLARERLDLALVVGNVDPAQMPSKVIEYLTLPVPRVALVAPPGDDAITDYVADKRGWLSVRADDPDVADAVRAHLDRGWTEEDLGPPPEEAWPAVGREIVDFLPEFLPRRPPAQAPVEPAGTTAGASVSRRS